MTRYWMTVVTLYVGSIAACTPSAKEPAAEKPAAEAAIPENLDLVILNGRVMDPETELDAVRNVGIKDGKIVVVTAQTIEGAETIDASGHVVAPGFIEGHQHATDQFSRKVNLRDGLTTQMDFEAGAGDIAKWYAEAEGKTQSNYGMVVLTTFARLSVLDSPEIAASGNDMGGLFSHVVGAAAAKAKKEGRKPGWSATLPNKEQMTEIMRLVDEGLRQGALGVGIPVGYMTTGVTQYELYKYQELASKYGRVSNAHVRFAGVRPPTEGQLGVQEMLANAMVLDAPWASPDSLDRVLGCLGGQRHGVGLGGVGADVAVV